jgi:hypothetical protein
MTSETRTFRLRALQCEKRARETPDSPTKTEWERLAVEWHAVANAIAGLRAMTIKSKLRKAASVGGLFSAPIEKREPARQAIP